MYEVCSVPAADLPRSMTDRDRLRSMRSISTIDRSLQNLRSKTGSRIAKFSVIEIEIENRGAAIERQVWN